jgi:predicted MFS family arabinose efflux permease
MLQVKRTFQRRVAAREVALVASATLLIAATYGMARFGVGLLHPAMAADRPGLAGALPSAGAAQFASYCLAAAAAALLVPRRSRAVAGAAGAVACVGCLGLTVSTSEEWFVASAFVGGAGAGLASPALVGMLDAAIPERLAGAAQAVVNSGTSLGVVGAGALSAVISAPFLAWPVMAGLCLVTATALVLLSSGTETTDAAPPSTTRRNVDLRLPVVAALTAGAISAAVWTYGPTAVLSREALQPGQVGLLWTALGLGGLAGAFINGPVSRLGPVTAFVLCTTALMVSSVGVLAPYSEGAWGPLISVACFGAAYMATSGVLILWGRILDPQRGAALTGWLFIALAVGQAVGAQLLGPLFT